MEHTNPLYEVNAYADAHQRLVQEKQSQVWQEGPWPLQLLQGLSRQLHLQQKLLNLACAARPAAARYDDIRRMQDLERCHRGTSNTQNRHSACRFYTCCARLSRFVYSQRRRLYGIQLSQDAPAR